MNVIFDSDTVIDVLKKRFTTALQIENKLQDADILGCSTITVGEIFAGMRKSEEEITKELLGTLKKFDVTTEIAELGGFLKKNTKSHALGLDDCLIAATAILNHAVLFTKNSKHYPFKNLRIKKIN